MVGVDLCFGAWRCVWCIYRRQSSSGYWPAVWCGVYSVLRLLLLPDKNIFMFVLSLLSQTDLLPAICSKWNLDLTLATQLLTLKCFIVTLVYTGSLFLKHKSSLSLSYWLALKASVKGWRALGLYRKSIFYNLEILLTFSKKAFILTLHAVYLLPSNHLSPTGRAPSGQTQNRPRTGGMEFKGSEEKCSLSVLFMSTCQNAKTAYSQDDFFHVKQCWASFLETVYHSWLLTYYL